MDNGIGLPEEPKTANELTIKELDDLFKEALKLEDLHGELKEKAAKVWHEVEAIQIKISTALEQLGFEKFTFSVGNFSYKKVQSFQTPKTKDDKEAFKQWCSEQQIDDSNMWSINHQTLNSLLKEQEELAADRGDFEFNVPGIQKGAVTTKITMKQTKQF